MTEHFPRNTVSADDPPDGYRYEWRADGEWRVGGDGRTCSMRRCHTLAVAQLRRKHRRFVDGFSWWSYCADHLYGRKIEEGIVKEKFLVKDEVA